MPIIKRYALSKEDRQDINEIIHAAEQLQDDATINDTETLRHRLDKPKIEELAKQRLDFIIGEAKDEFLKKGVPLHNALLNSRIGPYSKNIEPDMRAWIDSQDLKERLRKEKDATAADLGNMQVKDNPTEKERDELTDKRREIKNKIDQLELDKAAALKATDLLYYRIIDTLFDRLSEEDALTFALESYQAQLIGDERELKRNIADFNNARSAVLTVTVDAYAGQHGRAAESLNQFTDEILKDNLVDNIVIQALKQTSGNEGLGNSKMLHVDSANALWLGCITMCPGLEGPFMKKEKAEVLAKAKRDPNFREYQFYEEGLNDSLKKAMKHRKPGESIVFNTATKQAPGKGGSGHYEFYELRPINENPPQFILLNSNPGNPEDKNSPYIPGGNAPRDTLDLVHRIATNVINTHYNRKNGISNIIRHCLDHQSEQLGCGPAAVSSMLRRLLGTPGSPAKTRIETLPQREGRDLSADTVDADGALVTNEIERYLQQGSLLANVRDIETQGNSLLKRGANTNCTVSYYTMNNPGPDDFPEVTTGAYQSIMQPYHDSFMESIDKSIPVQVSNLADKVDEAQDLNAQQLQQLLNLNRHKHKRAPAADKVHNHNHNEAPAGRPGAILALQKILEQYMTDREEGKEKKDVRQRYWGGIFGLFPGSKSFKQKRSAVKALLAALDGKTETKNHNPIISQEHIKTLRNGELGKRLRTFIRDQNKVANPAAVAIVGGPLPAPGNRVRDFIAGLTQYNLDHKVEKGPGDKPPGL